MVLAVDQPSSCKKSEKCPKPCEPRCTEKRIVKKLAGSPTYLRSDEINVKCRNAVVGVIGVTAMAVRQTVQITGTEVPPPPTVTYIGTDLYRVEGSGFFTGDCGYIVTSAANVTVPLSAVVSRVTIPGSTTTVDIVRDPVPFENQRIARAQHVFVQVFNLHGLACSQLYEAVVVGVDGISNTAVLRIDMSKPFNKNRPTIKKAVYLKWGKPNKYPVGSEVFTITVSNGATRKFAGGFYSDMDIDNRFHFLPVLETTIPFRNPMVGGPLLDLNGNVIGLITGQSMNNDEDQLTESGTITQPTNDTLLQTQTLSDSDPLGNSSQAAVHTLGATIPIIGTVFALTAKIVKSIVRAFVKADDGKCTKRVILQDDELGSFFLYRKGFLNVHVELVTGATWLNHNVLVDTHGGLGVSSQLPTFTVRSPYYTALNGYFVRAINPDSVLFGLVEVGDIIVELACERIGDSAWGFYELLYDFMPGDAIKVTFLKNSNGYATSNCIYVRLEEPYVDVPLENTTVFAQYATPDGDLDPMPLIPAEVGRNGTVSGGGLGQQLDLSTP